MSIYTTEVRYICESLAGLEESEGYQSIENIIANSREQIFDFDYPIFDEEYKPVLETKILKHFYTREIGEETVGLWKLRLDTKLNEIMPYYNQLYRSQLLEFNPLYTTDLSTGRDITGSGENQQTTAGNDDTAFSGSDVKTEGGTESLQMTGTDTTVKTGTDASAHTGTQSLAETGTEKLAKTGTDTSVASGQDSDSTSSTSTGGIKDNSWTLFSDTPQGGINGIQNASVTPSLASNAYLTTATNVIQDQTGSSTTVSGSDTTTYGRQDQRTLNTTDTTTFGKTDTKTFGDTETVTHNTSDAETKNLTNTTNFGKTDTIQHGKRSDRDYSSSVTGSNSSVTRYLETVKGRQGYNPSKLLEDYRKTFLNIDMDIINKLETLFINLWA